MYSPGWGHTRCYQCRAVEYKKEYNKNIYKNPETRKKARQLVKEWYARNKDIANKLMMKWRVNNIDWYRTYQAFYQYVYKRGFKLGELEQTDRDHWCSIYFGRFTAKCPEKRDKYSTD